MTNNSFINKKSPRQIQANGFKVIPTVSLLSNVNVVATRCFLVLVLAETHAVFPAALLPKNVRVVYRIKSKSKPGRRVAGPFWAQAVNQKRQNVQIRIYKSLHFRPCRSCRKSQKVPTMLFCPVRIPSNARVVCSDRRL